MPGRKMDLPESLDANWLTLIGTALDLHPRDYEHPVQGKPITITSPVRWVVNYRTNYTLAQVANVLAGKAPTRPENLRQFMVKSLVLQLAINRNPGLVQLFRDLRYELKIKTTPAFKQLSVLTLTSTLTSFRPADELIAVATAFSGIPAFIEWLELDAVQAPKDMLTERLEELLKQAR